MNNRAVVLILTLWILTFLSAITLSVTYRMRIELFLYKKEQARAKSRCIAEAGLVQAVTVLNKDSNGYDALREEWSNYTEQLFGICPFREISVGEGRFNVSYIYERDIFSGVGNIFYGMQDEERKINVNKAGQDMLESLSGVTSEIALSIRAWRGDTTLTPDILFKEDAHYKGLSSPYERKGKDIEHMEELLLIRGVTRELLYGKDLDNNGMIDTNERGIIQYITVYGDGPVNINTAGITVLRAIGLTEDLVYKILRYRMGEDGILCTGDDGVFTDVETVGSSLSYFEGPLLPDEEKLLQDKKDWLKVTSRFYTAAVEGKVQGVCSTNIQAIIDKEQDEGNQVVRWIE